MASDRWSRWLLHRRDAGDASQRAATADHLAGVRRRVLAGAAPLAGATLLDVGAGDGLIGLAALDEVGPAGTVIFSDVSEALLERCREQADDLGLLPRARFHACRAEDLAGIDDGTVDVITTRSVLIYVVDKPAAFAAFARVLGPDGRLSLFEPINRLMFPEPPGRFFGYDVGAVADLAERVAARFVGDADADTAMRGFDDRDLVPLALDAGFARVALETHTSVQPGSTMSRVSFETLLGSSPNPNAPTIGEAIEDALEAPARTRFLGALGRAYRDGDCVERRVVAYLVASLR